MIFYGYQHVYVLVYLSKISTGGMGSFARQNFTSTPIRFSFDWWRQYLDKYARLFRQFCECTSTNMRMYFDNMRDYFDKIRLG